MALIYYKGNPQTYMEVAPGDVSYWTGQGWTTSPSSGATSSAPAPSPTQTAPSTTSPQTNPSAPAGWTTDPTGHFVPLSGGSTTPPGVVPKPDPSGRYYLVMFTSDPTPTDPATGASVPWLYDSRDKVYRPFADQSQFDAWARVSGSDPAALMKSVSHIDPQYVTTQSDWWGGQFLSTKYSPSSVDGSLPVYSAGSDSPGAAATKKYGMASDPQAEATAAKAISEVLVPRWQQLGILSQESLNILKDPNVLAKYVAASVYGGYLPQDIWRDLKINELAKTNPAYTGLSAVDENLTAQEFQNGDTFRKINTDPVLMPPNITLSGGEDLMKYPVYKMPDSYFQEQVGTIDWRDPKNQAEAEKISAGLYDVLLAKTEAQSAQDRQIADDNYNKYIDAVNKNYGLNLSRDAEQAWNQIQAIQNSYTSRGTGTSGLLEEAIQNHLKTVRKNNDLRRQAQTTGTDSALRNRLLNSASSKEIQDSIIKMDSEDQAAGKSPDQYRSVLWGLKPDQATLNQFSLDNLRKAYPDYTDDQIRMLRDSFIDENGNYRSKTYQTSITNMLNNRLQKMTYQQNQLIAQKQAAVAKANEPYTGEFTNYESPESKALAASQAAAIPAPAASTASPAAPATPAAPVGPKNGVYSIGTGIYINGKLVQTVADVNDASPAMKDLISKYGSSLQMVGKFPVGYDVNSWLSQNGYKSDGTLPSGSTSSPQSWAPPSGYEIINGAKYNTTASQQAAYSNIQTSPDGKNLYGIPKSSSTSTTPTQTTTSSQTSPTQTTTPYQAPKTTSTTPTTTSTSTSPAPSVTTTPVPAPSASSNPYAPITIRYKTGATMQVTPGDYDSYWKNQGWTK